jgi:hypothetical protein
MIAVPPDGAALSSGEWWGYSSPFRHWCATEVLDAAAYRRVATAFNSILETTAGHKEGPYRLSKSTARYDARMLAMNEDLAATFYPFFSDAWISSLHRFLSIPNLGRVDGALHSSPKGSRTGWVHNDLCSGWFDEQRLSASSIVFPDRSRCDYFTGRRKVESAAPREYVRAATMIYYLCNDGWKSGDGGETAFYSAARKYEQTRLKIVPPINNTLLLFECSPHSYHRFLGNPGLTRNSIIFWLHMDATHAVERWGDLVNRRSS